MPFATRAGLLALLSVAVLAGVCAVARGPAALADAGAELVRIRDADILFFEQRVGRDAVGAMDRVRLGALLLERARMTGSESDLERAEILGRESLAIRTAHNAAGWRLLASALLGQHRFAEALDAANAETAMAPDSPGARAMRGEILLELGRYGAADSVFGALAIRHMEPAVSTRYARWLELRGRAGEARAVLERAQEEARRRLAPVDQVAWFDLRLGDLSLRFGDPGQARERARAGLAVFPADWRLLALAARAELARGRPAQAIAYGDSSLARHLDPATLATVGDAWLAKGDSSLAESYLTALERLAGTAPRGGFHRAWYLALLDHDRQIPLVLEAVARDLTTRPDVYGYDLLAWALHKSGRNREARQAIAHALAWGSEDPQFAAHARAIRKAM